MVFFVPGDFYEWKALQDYLNHTKIVEQAFVNLNAFTEIIEIYVPIGYHDNHLQVEEQNGLKRFKTHIFANEFFKSFDFILLG